MLKRVCPTRWSQVSIMLNFPTFFKMFFDMIRAGSGYEFEMVLLPTGADLKQQEAFAGVADLSLLPKAIGGDAVSVNENGEEDEACVRGFRHERLSQVVERLEG